MVGAKSTVLLLWGTAMKRLASGLACVLACVCAATACGRRDVPAGEAQDASAASKVHVQISPAPAAGDVEPIVREEIARAAAERRRLVVYVGAEWCEPCQRFHNAARDGQLDAVFPDLTLLEFDLDRDGKRLQSAGYTSRYIPLFALPAPDGRSSGKQVEGGIKGEGAVGYVTARLKDLLAR
jgi:thiol:disulfide interchange protein